MSCYLLISLALLDVCPKGPTFKELGAMIMDGDYSQLESLDTELLGSESSDGNTLVHVAAALGKTRAIQILATRHVQIDRPNRSGVRPIHRAILNGDRMSVEVLIRSGAVLDVFCAAARNDLPALKGFVRDKAAFKATLDGVPLLSW